MRTRTTIPIRLALGTDRTLTNKLPKTDLRCMLIFQIFMLSLHIFVPAPGKKALDVVIAFYSRAGGRRKAKKQLSDGTGGRSRNFLPNRWTHSKWFLVGQVQQGCVARQQGILVRQVGQQQGF